MKKIICTAVSALALAAFADGVNSTEFGVLQVPSTAASTIVGVPWLESGTGSVAVNVADFVLTAGLNTGDKLYLYDTASKDYKTFWRLNESKVWEKDGEGPDTIARGSALKLIRTGSDLSKGFYIMGKPTTETGKVTMTQPESGSKAFTLIAFPFATDTSPNDSKLTWKGINGQYDSITVQLPDGSGYTLAYRKGKSESTYTWQKYNTETLKWEAAPTIKAGTGAWFITTDTATKSFEW